jgi:putative transposase
MADVFSQVSIHLVFAVKNRDALILPEWELDLHKYIHGIIEHRGHKSMAINGMSDHIHMFLGQKLSDPIPKLVEEIKKASSDFIKTQRLSKFSFNWQNGYGAFSYSKSQRDQVCMYIFNQKEHHKKRTFCEEYNKMIADFEIEVGRKEMFVFFD